MAISHRESGTWVASNATTQTVTLPTHATGDMLIVRTIRKPFTNPDDTVINTSGWTAVATGIANGATANGAGTGSMGFKAFWKIATSASETNPVVTWGTTSAPGAAVAISYQLGANEFWVTPTGNGGGDATARTSQTSTIATHISVLSADMVDFFRGCCDDNTLTVPTITQTGVTYGTVSEQPATALSSGTSNDISADGGYRLATAGTSSAAAVVTGTSSASDQHGAWMTRLRVAPSVTGTFTANAVIKKTITPTFTANAVIKKTVTTGPATLSSWTSNANGSALLGGVGYGAGNWVAASNASFLLWKKAHPPTGAWSSAAHGSNNFSDVAYGDDGRWVAVGFNGNIFTATDPLGTWTDNDQGSQQFNSVAYGNGYWVAVGDTGVLYYAVDPTGAWTSNTQGSESFQGVAYGNGYWVAVGTVSGLLRYAVDPTGAWTANNQGSAQLAEVTYANGLWVAVGWTSPNGAVYTTTDPTGAWTVNSMGTTDVVYGVTYGAGIWVATVANGGIRYTSTPTGAWTFVDAGSSTLYAAAYGNQYFVASGSSGAMYYATISGTLPFTADAVRKKTTSATFTASAVLKKTMTQEVISVELGSGGFPVGTNTVEQLAQRFTPTMTGLLSEVSYWPYRSAAGTHVDNLISEIRSSSGGEPSGVVLADVETVTGSTLPTVGSAVQRDVPVAVGVVGGTAYWLLLRRSGALDDTAQYGWRGGESIVAALPVFYYDGAWNDAGDTTAFQAVIDLAFTADAVIFAGIPPVTGSFTASAVIKKTIAPYTTTTFTFDSGLQGWFQEIPTVSVVDAKLTLTKSISGGQSSGQVEARFGTTWESFGVPSGATVYGIEVSGTRTFAGVAGGGTSDWGGGQLHLTVPGISELTGSPTGTDNPSSGFVAVDPPQIATTDAYLLTAAYVSNLPGESTSVTLTWDNIVALVYYKPATSFTADAVLKKTQGLPYWTNELAKLGPTNWWRLDDPSGTTAVAETGAVDGSYENSPTLGAPGLVSGDPTNNAVVLNGTDERVNFGGSLNMQDTGGTWGVLFRRARTGVWEWLLSKGTGQPNISFWSGDDGISVGANGPTFLAGPYVTDTERHLLVFVHEGPLYTQQFLYLDGVEVGTQIDEGSESSFSNNGGNFTLGSAYDGSLYFQGTIDEPFVLDYALSAEEVAVLWESLPGESPGLSFTANAVIKREQTGTFTANAVVLRTQTSSFTANAVLKRTVTGSFTANAIILVQWPRYPSPKYDVSVRGHGTPTTGAKLTGYYVRLGFAANSGLGAYLQAPAATVFLGLISRTGGVETGLGSISVTGAANYTNREWNVQVEVWGVHSASTLRARAWSTDGAFSTDWVTATGVSTPGNLFTNVSDTAGVVGGTLGVIMTTDYETAAPAISVFAIRLKTGTGSFTGNAVLKRTQTGTFTANAVILKAATGSFTADAQLALVVEGTFSASAVIKRTIERGFRKGPFHILSPGPGMYWAYAYRNEGPWAVGEVAAEDYEEWYAALWNVTTPDAGPILLGDSGSTSDSAFLISGDRIIGATASGGPFVLWSLSDPTAPSVDIGGTGFGSGYRPWNLEGQWLVGNRFDGLRHAVLWDLTDPSDLPVDLGDAPGFDNSTATAIRGSYIVGWVGLEPSDNADSYAALWDLNNPTDPPVVLGTTPVEAAIPFFIGGTTAFGRDGNTATVYSWDLTDPSADAQVVTDAFYSTDGDDTLVGLSELLGDVVAEVADPNGPRFMPDQGFVQFPPWIEDISGRYVLGGYTSSNPPQDNAGFWDLVEPSVDAVLLRVQTSSFTADAVVKASRAGSFTADAYIFSEATQTGAFTANAVVRAVVTGTFTANAVVLRTISGSTTANAVVRRTQTGSTTGNAVVKASITGSTTASAVIKRGQTGSFTGNAVVLWTGTGTFTANAVVTRLGQTGSFTAAACILATRSGSTTANAVIKASRAGSFTADAVIPGAGVGAFSADAVKIRTATGTFTANAVLLRTGAGTFTAAAWVQITRTGSLTANAVILRTASGTFTANAVVRSTIAGSFTASAVVKRTVAGSSLADAVLAISRTGTFTADAWLQRTVAGSTTANAVILRTQTGAFTANALIRRTQTSYALADAVLRSTLTGSFSVSAILLRGTTGSFTAEAWVQVTATQAFTASAVIKATISGGFGAYALIAGAGVFVFGADAVIKASRAGATTVDAALLRAGAGSLTADAWLQVQRTGSFTAAAVVKRTQTGSFFAHALILAIRANTFTAAAVVLRTQVGSSTADAVLFAARAGSLTADAVIALPGSVTGSFLANAVIFRNITGSTTANAVVLRGATGAFTADALLRRTQLGSLTADATILRTGTGSLTADAWLQRTVVGSFTANAVLLVSRAGSFTADAFFLSQTAGAGSFTANAVVLVSRTGTFTAAAVVRRTTAGSLTASAVIKTTIAGSFTGAAVILVSRSGSFTAAACIRIVGAGSFTGNAWISVTPTFGFSVNAVVTRTASVTMLADAVLRVSRSGSFSASAVTKRTAQAAFTTDAVVKATRMGGSVADAVLLSPRTGALSADAYVELILAGGSFSVDAVVLAAPTGSFPASAAISVNRTGLFTARAIVKAPRPGFFTADANVVGAGQDSFTVDASITGPGFGLIFVNASISKRIVNTGIEATFSARTIAPTVSARTVDFHWLWTRRSSFTIDAEIA